LVAGFDPSDLVEQVVVDLADGFGERRCVGGGPCGTIVSVL